ncbi:MAG: helix-turn-helix domain-containing protein [Patescibacteria group bacterium]
MSKQRKPLTYEERQIIEAELIKRKSFRKIGKILNREHTDVSREVKRNAGRFLPYSAGCAQLRAEKKLLGKKEKIIETNISLKKYVIESLRRLESPEQIAGRLREQVDDPPGQVSHETIFWKGFPFISVQRK